MYLKFPLGTIPVVNFVGTVKYGPSWKHFERVASEYILFFVHSGTLFIQEENIKYALNPNEVLILFPGKRHFGYKTSTVEYSYVHFELNNPQWVEPNEEEVQEYIVQNPQLKFHDEKTYNETFAFVPKHCKINDVNTAYKITELLHASAQDYFTGLIDFPATCSTKLVEIFVWMYRYTYFQMNKSYTKDLSKSTLIANDLRQYIDTNAYRDITSDMIVTHFGLNYDYLNRLLKKYYETTIRQYILIKKIEKAKDIIRTNDMKISTVGHLVGIENPFYFSKLFKKTTGFTPTEYYNRIK